jgi:eukaryotic-like serine/threonine-protein kinase
MAAKSIKAGCHVGEVLAGKWHLDALLGSGGMAHVFAATHRNAYRAAIKVLRPELVGDRGLCARFLREGYAANRVGHRGTVRVVDDDFTRSGTPFLVMELLEGETLGARLARCGPLHPSEVLLIGEELLDMLAVAHRRGIVHRDLKPENLFVTREGYLKVLDFGLARVREGSRQRVNSMRFGSVLGTPAYMAPEQAKGDWYAVDDRTDLWAVGATLFTLATGRFVHEGNTKSAQIEAAVTLPVRPVQELAPRLPVALAAIIDRALAFEPEQRWPSARAMLRAVRQAERNSDVPPSVEESSKVPRPSHSRQLQTMPSVTLVMSRAGRRQTSLVAWLRSAGHAFTMALARALRALGARGS